MELREIFIKQPEMKELLLRSAIGLEKENMRVWGDGHIALTPHPFGNKATHPFITTDFSESQVEIGTEVCANPHQVYDQLESSRYRLHHSCGGERCAGASLAHQQSADDPG